MDPLENLQMKGSRVSAAVVMLVLCLLPLLVFYVLALSGVHISPMLVILILILCCMTMMHMMMGSGEGASCHGHASEPTPQTESPVELPTNVTFDDLIQVKSTENIGGVLVLRGDLLSPADDVADKLQERLRGTGFTALLKEDEHSQTQVLFLPVELEQVDFKQPNNWINLGLFVATILTTTWAGALHQGVNLLEEPGRFGVGLPYSLGLMLILGAHELGHYFAARAHGMRVTLPYFIPIPFALGTFGAFIRLKSPARTRRALFDVGVAGPLAGLVFTVPALLFGLTMSSVVPAGEQTGPAMMMHGGTEVGSSILLTILAKLSMGDAISHGHVLALHPLAFAGWLGLLVTALNLLPIGQLDGGHISDAMFGTRRSSSISSAALFTLFFLGLFVWSGLLFWAFIAWFIAGRKGLPPLNDITRLDPARFAVGVFSFVLLFAILIPVPHAFWQSLGIHCPYL